MTQDERWEKSFNLLIKYYKEYGDIHVPREYTVDGVKLGEWLSHQITFYNKSKLFQERIDKLNELNPNWCGSGIKYKKQTFEFYYNLLKKYHEQYGNIDIPGKYEIDGVKLGAWLSRIRHLYKAKKLSQKVIDMLNELGMTWEIKNVLSFDDYYLLLKDYYKEYGDINVPKDYEINGIKLGRWLGNLRDAYNDRDKKTHTITRVITQEEIDKLNELGVVWRFFYANWTENYKLVVEYYKKYGNIDIPYDYVVDDVYLGYWLSVQRELYAENSTELPKARILKLNKLRIDWNVENTRLLNKSVNDIEIYNSVLNKRVNYILRDFIFEDKNEIISFKKQKQMEKELIKRIWR